MAVDPYAVNPVDFNNAEDTMPTAEETLNSWYQPSSTPVIISKNDGKEGGGEEETDTRDSGLVAGVSSNGSGSSSCSDREAVRKTDGRTTGGRATGGRATGGRATGGRTTTSSGRGGGGRGGGGR